MLFAVVLVNTKCLPSGLQIGTLSFGVPEYTETPPILKFLLDHCGGGLGLQP